MLIHPASSIRARLASKRSLNVALVGLLSSRLDIPEQAWLDAIRASLGENLYAANLAAFQAGRA